MARKSKSRYEILTWHFLYSKSNQVQFFCVFLPAVKAVKAERTKVATKDFMMDDWNWEADSNEMGKVQELMIPRWMIGANFGVTRLQLQGDFEFTDKDEH